MKYLESYEDRRLKEINLLDDYKEDARDLFYDLMDIGYVVHPSHGSVTKDTNGEKFVNYSVHITKSDGHHSNWSQQPFIFSDIISFVDDFIYYLEHIKAKTILCKATFANYVDDKQFQRKYGVQSINNFHSWEDLKQKIKEYIDTPAVLVSLQISYTINI